MPAYLISRVKVTDEARFAAYRAASAPIVAQFGGEYLHRTDAVETLDGEPYDGRRLVILRFPTSERARAFWNSAEYQAARKLRLGAAQIDIWLAPGD